MFPHCLTQVYLQACCTLSIASYKMLHGKIFLGCNAESVPYEWEGRTLTPENDLAYVSVCIIMKGALMGGPQ